MEGQNLAYLETKNNKRAVYPGSFDPLTFGHIDLVERSLGVFDEVTLLIAENRKKNSFLSIEERINLAKEYFNNNPRIKIEPWDKNALAGIQKAIIESDLGINPQNMGAHLFLPVPPMTEERRKKLVKIVKFSLGQ